MKKVLIALGLLVAMSMLVGCEDKSRSSGNLKAAYLIDPPVVQVYRDASFLDRRCKTFSVIPFSSISKKAGFEGILEKQMLFALRNAVEARGYTFVEPSQSPDFLVTIDGSIPYREKRIPPTVKTVSTWVPPKTTTTTDTTTSSDSGYGSRGYKWGTHTKTTNSTKTTQGHTVTKRVRVPGYKIGVYYPSLTVRVLDPQLNTEIWNGTGAGSSDNPDIRISGQFVLARIMMGLPPFQEDASSAGGWLGFGFAVATAEGNDYYPAVAEIAPKSPASRSHLLVEDFIVSIDGVPTQNEPWSAVRALLRGEPGKKTVLRVLRGNKTLDIPIVYEPAP